MTGPPQPPTTRSIRVDSRAELVVWIVVGAPMLLAIARFIHVALARIRYPFELEWMEGGMVDHIRMILSGESLYRPPSLAFTPFIYVPGYDYVCAAVSKVVGVGLFAPRLVSFVSILGCFATLATWARKETADPVAGMLAAGLFAATYGESGFWFDVARVDSLFLFFLLSGTVLSRFGTSHRSQVTSGLLLASAVLTKQTGLVMVMPSLLFRLLSAPRRSLWTLIPFTALVLAVFGILEITSRGWFSFYAFGVPAGHDVALERWHVELMEHLVAPMLPMALCALAVVVRGVPLGGARIWMFYAAWIVLAFATSFSSLLHAGGYFNVLMPVHAALALCAGVVFTRLRRGAILRFPTDSGSIGRVAFGICGLGLQLALLAKVEPMDLIPTSADVEAGRQVLAEVNASPGPVWMVSSGYYPLLARGDKVTAHAMGMTDVFRSRKETVKDRLRTAVVGTIRAKFFKTIVLDRASGFLPPDIVDEIHRNYRLKKQLLSPEDRRFWPKVGASVRPDQLWEPTSPN